MLLHLKCKKIGTDVCGMPPGEARREKNRRSKTVKRRSKKQACTSVMCAQAICNSAEGSRPFEGAKMLCKRQAFKVTQGAYDQRICCRLIGICACVIF